MQHHIARLATCMCMRIYLARRWLSRMTSATAIGSRFHAGRLLVLCTLSDCYEATTWPVLCTQVLLYHLTVIEPAMTVTPMNPKAMVKRRISWRSAGISP